MLFLPKLSTSTIFRNHPKTPPLNLQPAKINNHSSDQQIQSHHKILHKKLYNLQQFNQSTIDQILIIQAVHLFISFTLHDRWPQPIK